MSKRSLRVLVLVVSTLTIYPGAKAQEKALKKINWGVTSLSAGNWILWIAEEAKIYEKQGLDLHARSAECFS